MSKLPIETIREGNKITKICVEDIYKMINRIQKAMDDCYNNSTEIIESIHKEYNGFEGELIIGRGISQPCLTDAFDEEIGNNIAFMKAKLNANIKKYNILSRLLIQVSNLAEIISNEMDTIEDYIYFDIDGIRQHNPDYLIDKY